jgi:hypothetical protein
MREAYTVSTTALVDLNFLVLSEACTFISPLTVSPLRRAVLAPRLPVTSRSPLILMPLAATATTAATSRSTHSCVDETAMLPDFLTWGVQEQYRSPRSGKIKRLNLESKIFQRTRKIPSLQRWSFLERDLLLVVFSSLFSPSLPLSLVPCEERRMRIAILLIALASVLLAAAEGE